MLYKKPKSWKGKSYLKSSIKSILFLEVVFFATTFSAWQQLRTSRGCFVNETYRIYWISTIRLKNTSPLIFRIELWITRSGKKTANYLNDYLISMAFVKPLFWLIGWGGGAYILCEIISPKDSDIRKYLPEGQVHHRPDLNQQPSFIESLQKAALEKKLMLHKKELESNNISKTINTSNSVEK